MKLNSNHRVLINILCTVEQWAILTGTIWLVGWKSWSAWWFVLAILLMSGCSPKSIIPMLEGEKDGG